MLQQQKEHIQEIAYQCIWNNYIIFAQKCYNSTTLSMWIVYKHVCVKIQLCLKIWFSTFFDITRYAEAAIYTKIFFFSHSIISYWSLVKHMGSDGVKLTKCEKVELGKKWHYASDVLFEWLYVMLP